MSQVSVVSTVCLVYLFASLHTLVAGLDLECGDPCGVVCRRGLRQVRFESCGHVVVAADRLVCVCAPLLAAGG